ncbi:hypothetical protein D3C78_943060 [compost metagenome]
MGGHAGIAVVQAMGGGLADEGLADPLLQLVLLAIGSEQIPQLHAMVAKQAEVQLAHGGDPQPIATGAEVLAVGHDEPHSPL